MAEDLAALRAEVSELKSEIVDFRRRFAHHDGQLKIRHETVENLMGYVKELAGTFNASVEKVTGAQAQVMQAKSTMDNLHGRMDAVEKVVEGITSGP